MGWNRSLDHAEQTGKNAAHLQTKRSPRASEGSRTHRKSTAHNDPSTPPLPSSAYPDPEQEAGKPHSGKVRTGIVSVNGCDVGVMHCQRS